MKERLLRLLPGISHWFKYTWLVASGAFLLLGTLLFIVRTAEMGLRDTRWSTISRTGLPSTLEGFKWTEWQPNDGQVLAYGGYKPTQKKRPIQEYRMAKANDLFFDFTFYQGRYSQGMGYRVIPATGPYWGTHYQANWAWICFSIGGVLYMIYLLVFFRNGYQPSAPEDYTAIWREASSPES